MDKHTVTDVFTSVLKNTEDVRVVEKTELTLPEPCNNIFSLQSLSTPIAVLKAILLFLQFLSMK